MQQPEIHLDLARARHSDLLRLARTGELAARLAAARREERRSFVTRIRGEGEACVAPSVRTAR